MRILLRDLTPGTDYNIQLRANDGTNVSDWSRIFPLTTIQDTLAPAAPTNLTWVTNRTAFSAKWDAVTQNADASPLEDFSHYLVKIQIPGGSYVTVKTNNTFYDLSFETNKAMFGTPQPVLECTVYAVDTTGNVSEPSSTVAATNPPPPDPTGVLAAGIMGGVSMRWDVQDIDDLEAYDIFMSTTGAGFTPNSSNQVYSGTGNAFLYDTSSLGAVHYFKIRSRDVFNSISGYVTVSATPLSPVDVDTDAPAIPTGLTASMTVDSNDSAFATATVSWTAPADTDLAGYVVRYKQDSATGYDFVNVPAGTTSVVIGGLVVGVQYNFSVQAFDRSSNRSAFTSSANATAANTAPSTPAAPTASASTLSVQVNHSLQKATSGRLESDVAYLEVHLGTASGFTASDSTLIGQLQVEPGSTFVSEVFSVPATDSTQARWVRVIAVDRGGLKSTQSASASVTVGLVENANIANATITSAKISNLEANKLTAGTGIINNLAIKAGLTVDTNGLIKSSNYIAGTSGYQLSNNTLEINQGTIRAAALLLQDAPNIVLPQYADFEFQSTWYTGKTVTFNDGGTTTWAIATAPEVTPKFGTQCLKHTWTGGGTYSRVYQGSSYTDYNVIVEPNTDYIASVWVFNPTGSGDKTVGFGVKMGDGTTYPQPGGTQTVVANGTWTRISGTFNTGANNSLMTYMSLYSAGSVYFDGIQIERKLTSATTPSPWRAPSTTSIDGGIIRTGEVRSTALANGLSGQPAWSINMTGGAQFGDAQVRGRIVVGDPSNPSADGTASRIHSANYVAGTSGWIIRNDGYAEFRNLAVNSIKVTALDAPMQNNTYAKLFDYMQDGNLWLSNGSVQQKTDPGAYSAESLFEFTGPGLVLRNAIGVTKVAYDPTILYRISARIRAYEVANLNANSGFETDTSGYTVYGSSTLVRDTTKKFSGNASMRVDQRGTNTGVYGFRYVLENVRPGYTYTCRLKFLPNSTVSRDNFNINIIWRDSGGAAISTELNPIPPATDANGNPIAIDGVTWVDASVQGVAPAGAAAASFEINTGISGTATTGSIAWFDDIQITTPPRIKVGLFGFDNSNNIIDWDYVDDVTTPTKKHPMPTDYSLLSGYANNQYMMVMNNSEVQIATGSSNTTADWITVTGYVRGRGGAGTTGELGTQGERPDPYNPAALNQSVRYLVPYVEWDIANGSKAQLDQFSIEAYENGAPAKVATKDYSGDKAVSVENIPGTVFDHAIRFYSGDTNELQPGMIGHTMDGDLNDSAHLRISPPLINNNSDYGNVYIGIYDRNPNYIYDATFEDSISGWTGMANTTLSQETSIGREDTNSLRITATGTISNPATTELLAKYSVSTLTNQELVGQKVVVSGYAMMASATGRNVRLVVKFMNESGGMITGYFLEKAVTNTAWTNFAFVSPIEIPDTCYSVEFSFSWFNGATGDVVLVDDVQLEMARKTEFRSASASRITLQSDVVRSNGGIIISSSELDLPSGVWGEGVGGRADTLFYPGIIVQTEGGSGSFRYVNYTDSLGNRAATQLGTYSPSGVEETMLRIYSMNDAANPGRWVLSNAAGSAVIASYPDEDGDMTTSKNVRVYGHLDVVGNPTWKKVTVTNGTQVSNTYDVAYYVNNGMVFLRGCLSGVANRTNIFVLPTEARPAKPVWVSTTSWDTPSVQNVAPATLYIKTDGTVQLYQVGATRTYVGFDGLSFSIAPEPAAPPTTGDTTAPGTPSGFKITPLSSSTSTGTYRLNWTNPSASDTAGVKIIWRSDRYPNVTIASSGTKTLTTDGKIITVTGGPSASKQYDHSGLPVNKTIYYRVVAYDKSGNHSAAVSTGRYLLASPITVTANSSDSYRLGYGGMWRNDGDELYQGDWAGNDNHRGAWFYGNKIYDALSKGGVVRTPTKVALYMKRLSTSHGNNTGVGVNLRGHTYTSKPSGDPVGKFTNEGGDGDNIVYLSRGEAANVTVPSSWYNNLVDSNSSNRIKGFGIYGTSTSDYLVLYGVSTSSSQGKLTIYHKG